MRYLLLSLALASVALAGIINPAPPADSPVAQQAKAACVAGHQHLPTPPSPPAPVKNSKPEPKRAALPPAQK